MSDFEMLSRFYMLEYPRLYEVLTLRKSYESFYFGLGENWIFATGDSLQLQALGVIFGYVVIQMGLYFLGRSISFGTSYKKYFSIKQYKFFLWYGLYLPFVGVLGSLLCGWRGLLWKQALFISISAQFIAVFYVLLCYYLIFTLVPIFSPTIFLGDRRMDYLSYIVLIPKISAFLFGIWYYFIRARKIQKTH